MANTLTLVARYGHRSLQLTCRSSQLTNTAEHAKPKDAQAQQLKATL